MQGGAGRQAGRQKNEFIKDLHVFARECEYKHSQTNFHEIRERHTAIAIAQTNETDIQLQKPLCLHLVIIVK